MATVTLTSIDRSPSIRNGALVIVGGKEALRRDAGGGADMSDFFTLRGRWQWLRVRAVRSVGCRRAMKRLDRRRRGYFLSICRSCARCLTRPVPIATVRLPTHESFQLESMTIH